jgi:hypothetical protein
MACDDKEIRSGDNDMNILANAHITEICDFRHQFARLVKGLNAIEPLVVCFLCSVLVALPVTRVAATNTQSDAYKTTLAYVQQFYPLWFTYNQSRSPFANRLVGPVRVSPLYQGVVAINVDTVYASSFLDLTKEPVILTIPTTSATYSILTLDAYCNVFDSGIPRQTAGAFALTGPGFSGELPPGGTRIPVPLNFPTLIFRVDKFSATGENQIAQAEAFRSSLRLQTLSGYLKHPSEGHTLVLPEVGFSVPFKRTADALIADAPITFLRQLQTAVASLRTPPLSPSEQPLVDRFNDLFGNGDVGRHSDFAAGAQAAHNTILDRYLTHLGPTNWIHFTNIGHWGDQVIERSAITEFIQYANDIEAAAYYHTFKDGKGLPLDGSNPHGYVLSFPAGQLPKAKRFWSLTAYTPKSIELVRNPKNKYVVASYTEGLKSNADGSLSVYMARDLPAGVPVANWLPIPRGAFNIMLRVYGPEGSVADNTYVPPAID